MAIFSSFSSEPSGTGTRTWIHHGLVVGSTVAAAAAGGYAALRWFGKFRSRVVGIIPARFKSSRFQGKPLVPILGKPMIQVNALPFLLLLCVVLELEVLMGFLTRISYKFLVGINEILIAYLVSIY